MQEPAPVQDYHNERKTQILSAVRKYPLYSLDKLKTFLPGIGRHSIQRVLEKHDLSTTEKRLVYSGQFKEQAVDTAASKISGFTSVKDFLRLGWSKLPLKFLNSMRDRNGYSYALVVRNRKMIMAVAAGAIVTPLFLVTRVKTPEIVMDAPQVGYVNVGENLFVSGKVKPAGSRVTVNGSRVALNGDGSFTAITLIPVGESVVEISAQKLFKKATIIRPVARQLTDEEQAHKEEEKEALKQKRISEVADIDRKVNDLLAVKNSQSAAANIRILESKLKEESGFSNVMGKLVNVGDVEIAMVMITAHFLDENGGEIDLKYGFATDFNTELKPNGEATFETQATNKKFARYTLEASWEPVRVAGVAVGKEQSTDKAASGSGRTSKE